MHELELISADGVLQRDLFIRIGDLIHIDGPLLTLFQDQKDAIFYLFDWVDDDNNINRWIIYRVSADDILDYLGKKIRHRELFSRAEGSMYYYADIDATRLTEYEIRPLRIVPEIYAQTENTLFDEEYSPDVQKIALFVNRVKASKANENVYYAPHSVVAFVSTDNDETGMGVARRIASKYYDWLHYSLSPISGHFHIDDLPHPSIGEIKEEIGGDVYIYSTKLKSPGSYARQVHRISSKKEMEIFGK